MNPPSVVATGPIPPRQDDLRASALAAAAEGRYLDAIAFATRCHRDTPDEELERLLVTWRLAAFAAMTERGTGPAWPPQVEDPFPGVRGLPEIPAAQLDSAVLAGAIIHHGGLIVRGLIPATLARTLASGIDQSLAAADAWSKNSKLPPSSWFSQIPGSDYNKEIYLVRGWTRASGAVWAAESPRMLFELTELLEQSGVLAAVTGYLSERPLLSLLKTTLRKVPAGLKGTAWHQDGAFLGKDIRSVNLWLALSPCGRDAAGLDFLPKRIPYIVETGTHGAVFDWAVGDDMAQSLAHDAPIASPEFEAGDAMLFDHFFLHRTSLPPNRSKNRWAIEAWMFAPTGYPLDQVPITL